LEVNVDIIVRGRHLDVSDRFRNHVVDKLDRADRFGLPITHIDVEISHEPNPRQADRAYEVELTCRGGGPVIRAEAVSSDKYSALDLAWGRLEERLRRAADKRRNRRHQRIVLVAQEDAAPPPPAAAGEDVEIEVELDNVELLDDGTVWAEGPIEVRLKEHDAAPMSVSQAVEAMELVGHDFYLFHELETGAPAVIYRRRGFSYGLIRLDRAGA
jgi:ribosomal subunit interface protein